MSLVPPDAWPGWEGLDPFRRLRISADAYGWTEDERRRLPHFGVEATCLSYERMEYNVRVLGGGWARKWDEGVGGIIDRRRIGWMPTPAAWSGR